MCYGNPLGAYQKYVFSGEKLHRKCFAHPMAQMIVEITEIRKTQVQIPADLNFFYMVITLLDLL